MSRKLIVTTFISAFLFSAIVGVRFVPFVAANPILVDPSEPSSWPPGSPRPVMPEEYINVTISLVDKNLSAKVDGTYLFYNAGGKAVRMDYPLPPNTTNISVKMNETWLDWTYNNKTYPTVIGDWTMINWTTTPAPDHFIIKTHYEHPISVINGNYTFLYAVETGRYQAFPWITTAYVNIRTEINLTDLHVYTIGFIDETWTWNPMDYKITEENTTEIITLKIVFQPFTPLKGLLITFTYQVVPEFLEFPSAIILPLFIIATLLAVTVYRKKTF